MEVLPSKEDVERKLRSKEQDHEVDLILASIIHMVKMDYSGESLYMSVKKLPGTLVRREVVRRGLASGWMIEFHPNNPRGDGPHITIE